MSEYVQQNLRMAGIGFSKYRLPGTRTPVTDVYLTNAMQLIGPHRSLKAARPTLGEHYIGSAWAKKKGLAKDPEVPYSSWESHHVVERHDLDRLGLTVLFPKYDDQLCVLLPQKAHQERISGVLRNANPSRQIVTVDMLLKAYNDSYSILGDYTGGGADKIKDELFRIVKVTFHFAGLIPKI